MRDIGKRRQIADTPSDDPIGILFGRIATILAVTLGSDPMTRLTDPPPVQAKRLAELECPQFGTRPWVRGTELSRRLVAIVSSAGLVMRSEADSTDERLTLIAGNFLVPAAPVRR
jgi:hypothetical protein